MCSLDATFWEKVTDNKFGKRNQIENLLEHGIKKKFRCLPFLPKLHSRKRIYGQDRARRRYLIHVRQSRKSLLMYILIYSSNNFIQTYGRQDY